MKYIIAIAIVLVGGLLFMNKDKFLASSDDNTATVASAEKQGAFDLNISSTTGGKFFVKVNGVNSTSTKVEKGATVKLVVIPDADHTVKSVDGVRINVSSPCYSYSNCEFKMNANKSISITFAKKPEYTMSIKPNANGAVEINGATGTSVTAMTGTWINLVAKPAPGYTFTNWGFRYGAKYKIARCGVESGPATQLTCSVSLDGDMTITPVFKKSTK